MAYDFDLPFQRRLLAAAWADPKWFRQHREVVRPEFFTDEVLGSVAEALGLVHKQLPGEAVPDLPSVLEAVKPLVAQGRKFDEYAAAAKRVHKLQGTNTAYYHEKAVEFARRAALLEAVTTAHEAIQAGDIDKVQPLIQRALRTGEGTSTKYYDLLERVADRIGVYTGLDTTDARRRVPTGFGPIDEACGGGLGPGEIGCFMGLPKHGKSTALVTVGKHGVLTGRNVLHVSLENSVALTAAKYDTALFGRPIEELKKLPNKFRKAMVALRESLQGRLKISYFPSKSLSVGALEGVIEGAGPVDEVLVDYAALMRPEDRRADRRLQISQVYEDLRRLTGEVGTRIWTAHQANRPGVDAKILGMEHLAECFEIMGIIDIGVSVNSDPARRAELVLSVMGSRIGKSEFNVDCTVDWATSTIKVLSDEV